MKHIILFISLLAAMLCGCSKDISEATITISAAFELKNLTGSNSPNCAKVYKNEIYYVREAEDRFIVTRLDPGGKELSHFDIPYGKGPGEALHSMGLEVNERGIFFSDLHLKKISLFDFDGNYIDCINFDRDSGTIVYFDIAESYIFTTTMDSIFLGKIDLETGMQTAFIPREGKTKTEIGSTFIGGPVKYDIYNHKIYMGLAGRPYTIQRYDKDLNPLGKYSYKLENEYEPIKVYPGPRAMGDFTILSMAITPAHIYAPHISARYFMKENRPAPRLFTPEILRFDKTTKKADMRLSIKNFDRMQGEFSVLYADDEKLVTLASGAGDWVKQLYPGQQPDYTNTLLILDIRPLKTDTH